MFASSVYHELITRFETLPQSDIASLLRRNETFQSGSTDSSVNSLVAPLREAGACPALALCLASKAF